MCSLIKLKDFFWLFLLCVWKNRLQSQDKVNYPIITKPMPPNYHPHNLANILFGLKFRPISLYRFPKVFNSGQFDWGTLGHLVTSQNSTCTLISIFNATPWFQSCFDVLCLPNKPNLTKQTNKLKKKKNTLSPPTFLSHSLSLSNLSPLLSNLSSQTSHLSPTKSP